MPASLAPNRLTALRADLRRTGAAVIDLTESNPTRAGLSYPEDLLTPLADPRGLHYRPEPFGLLEARCAVVERLRATRSARRRGPCGPHGQHQRSLRCPVQAALRSRAMKSSSRRPVTRCSNISPRSMACGRFRIRSSSTAHGHSISARSTRSPPDRTRAVLIVSPNNPTGHFIARAEMRALADWCRCARSADHPG